MVEFWSLPFLKTSMTPPQQPSASPNDHCIGVLYGFLWQDSRMNSTENDYRTFLSIPIGQLIASICRRSHARNPNQVEIQRKIYLSDFFIHNGDINIIWRQ